MSELLDDEFKQMDEREFEEELEMQEAVTINDPITSLELQKMVVVESDTTIARVIELFQAERVACVLVTEDGTLSGIFTERDVIMKEFRTGSSRVLITTDLLARGIDVQQVSLVINYDIPINNEKYIQISTKTLIHKDELLIKYILHD